MFEALEIVVALEDGHDIGLGAATLSGLWPLLILIPCVSFPSHPLAALHLVSQLPQNVDGHGGSFCNLGIELSEQWRVLRC